MEKSQEKVIKMPNSPTYNKHQFGQRRKAKRSSVRMKVAKDKVVKK